MYFYACIASSSCSIDFFCNSMVWFVTTIWISLFTISQSKVITVNNEQNYSVLCCVNGECICGSLSDALEYLDNDTIINITSRSVALHGYNRIANLNNITITASNATIMCNNSGIVFCISCRNFVIEGLIWDQCGSTEHPNYTHGIGFIDASNISILSSTFQHSGVCTVVVLSTKLGTIKIHNSNFLYNHVTDPSRCILYSSLFIISEVYNETQTIYSIIIFGTVFHHNGVFSNVKHRNDHLNSALYLSVSRKNYALIYIENSTISESGNLGANLICKNVNTLEVVLHEVNGR